MGICKPVGPECQMIDHLHIQIEQGIYRIYKEVGILKVRKQKEVHTDTHNDPEALPGSSACIVYQIPQVEI